jgi:ubiquitin-activating enzyme E1
MHEVVFEKDDPTNWHIEFVAAVANLRARNYKIAEVPAFKVKLIAGKIIPALATTTAMIVG